MDSEQREGRRARSLEELERVFGRLLTADGIAAGLAFVPGPGDVIVSSFAKCGTTWLQQIVQSLRSGGDLDFDDISRVVPWIETAADLGLDLDEQSPWRPRAFKSHLSWDQVPKAPADDARYIVSLRDPRDAALSLYRFFEGWFFEPGTIDLELFVRARFIDGAGYYEHFESWWPRRNDDNVLLLAYEQMLDRPEASVARIADFIGVGADPALLDAALEQSSFAAMKANQSKYDDVMMRALSERACGLPPDSASSKVATGQTGGHEYEFSDELRADFDAVWAERLAGGLELDSYAAVLTELADRG